MISFGGGIFGGGGSGGGGSNAATSDISVVRLNLTDAQIKALHTTPQTVVAAPGAGHIVMVLCAALAIDTAAAAYVGGGAAYLTLDGGTASMMDLALDTFFTADVFAGKVSYATYAAPTGVSTEVDAPLKIAVGVADFTGGNAANKATLTVWYRIVSSVPV